MLIIRELPIQLADGTVTDQSIVLNNVVRFYQHPANGMEGKTLIEFDKGHFVVADVHYSQVRTTFNVTT